MARRLVTATTPLCHGPAPYPSTHAHNLSPGLARRRRTVVTSGVRDAFEKLSAGVPLTDRHVPERHGLRRGGRRATGRGCVTAAGRAAAA